MFSGIFGAIGFFAVGILVAVLFVLVRTRIANGVKEVIKGNTFNATIGKSYLPDGTEYEKGKENFSIKKFLSGMFSVFNPILWVKDISSIFNLRKLTIYFLIIGLVFAYGWYQGKQGKAVKVDLGYGKEAYIRLNGDFLHITKDGHVYLEDKDGNVKKQISVKDIPGLKAKLAPLGLHFKPIAVVGGSMGTGGDAGLEVGGGFSFARFWKWSLDAFVTTYPAVYVGTSYKLEGIGLKNSSIGIGVGKGFRDFKEGDVRAIIYFKMEF